MSKVLVVGSANADLVARVQRFPSPGETVMGLGFEVHPGGKGANQAVAAARIGAETTFVGCIGQDSHGRLLSQSMLGSGVDVRHLQVAEGAPTGLAIILVDGSGQNQITVIPGANQRIDAAAIPIAGGPQTLLIQLEIPVSVVNDCLGSSKRAGITTILNPAPSVDYNLIDWTDVDVVVPNETEASQLGQIAANKGFAGVTIVTLGKEGFELKMPGEAPRRGRSRDVAPVDTTGAGDCFCGVLAALWSQTEDKFATCQFAAMAASISVTRAGAQPSMPTYDEVRDLIGPSPAFDRGE